MIQNKIVPRKALNKAFLKVKVFRDDFEKFKQNLIAFLDKINEIESEEFHKNLLADFLKNTYYYPEYFINTKGRNDLVIHNGNDAQSKVGIILEMKKPANKSEMLKVEQINTKALHELLLYYLRERITEQNLELKYLIATNIYGWFIFDAQIFDKYFAQNKQLVKQFTDFEAGRLSIKTTDLFYKQIAQPAIANIENELIFTYFDFRDYTFFCDYKPQRTQRKQREEKEEERDIKGNEDRELITLFKLLSPFHLLKLPFVNHSNSLDKGFYNELLHIMGLTEVKEGGKKLIQRLNKGHNHQASFIENAINQIEISEKIEKNKSYEEELFNVSLELVITWLNRILFLKLLEAQLINYHRGDTSFSFLNLQKIPNYHVLNNLFFRILAYPLHQRKEEDNKLFANIPYLNSSLFEITETEKNLMAINSLESEIELPIFATTVLKDNNGNKRIGKLNALQYLFEFLDAYDFGNNPQPPLIREAKKEIFDDNKKLINASVLGLIFEKINGYKDGSFFTPSFITMYMCRETIRRAVVQKFNEIKGWHCENIDDLYNKIDNKKEANTIINSLKICDPAVGSGHFLVSALNEIIAIKSELKILLDRQGKTLRDYQIEVIDDELIVTDDDGELFQYNPKNQESQRIQEALFHEKQTIIENCLFGVDINPNSVKICRLRLWIELLKNAYYLPSPLTHLPLGEGKLLQTLPNIDINIKCGNSLISRYKLDADLRQALKKNKLTIDVYKNAVKTYHNSKDKQEKREIENLISQIKNNFTNTINSVDFRLNKLRQAEGELNNLLNQISLFEESKTEKKARESKQKKLEKEINLLIAEIEDMKSNRIYNQAFEWRFEFPEVLNDEGDFVGFDIVIGNPPYFSISAESSLNVVANQYLTFSATGDIYALFIELGINILKSKGIETFIISNKWMRANYGATLRKYLVENINPLQLIDFGQNLLFDHAIVHTNIILSQKLKNSNQLQAVRFPDGFFDINTNNFINFIQNNTIENLSVSEDIWNVINPELHLLKNKIENIGKKLLDWDVQINFGIKTGYNEAFIIDEQTKEKLLQADAKNEEIIKPILRGRDTRRYYCNYANLWIINSHNGYKNVPRIDVINDYSKIYEYLLKYKQKASVRFDQGEHWTNLRNCAYLEKFKKPKIIFSEIVSEPQFYYDEEGYYPEATVFFISGKNLKYLTALLNSKAVTFFFKTFYMGGELVGKIRYKKAFLQQVPLPIPTTEIETQIDDFVTQILAIKKANSNQDTSKLEREIDLLVYELYSLTEEEIALIENTN